MSSWHTHIKFAIPSVCSILLFPRIPRFYSSFCRFLRDRLLVDVVLFMTCMTNLGLYVCTLYFLVYECLPHNSCLQLRCISNDDLVLFFAILFESFRLQKERSAASVETTKECHHNRSDVLQVRVEGHLHQLDHFMLENAVTKSSENHQACEAKCLACSNDSLNDTDSHRTVNANNPALNVSNTTETNAKKIDDEAFLDESSMTSPLLSPSLNSNGKSSLKPNAWVSRHTKFWKNSKQNQGISSQVNEVLPSLEAQPLTWQALLFPHLIAFTLLYTHKDFHWKWLSETTLGISCFTPGVKSMTRLQRLSCMRSRSEVTESEEGSQSEPLNNSFGFLMRTDWLVLHRMHRTEFGLQLSNRKY